MRSVRRTAVVLGVALGVTALAGCGAPQAPRGGSTPPPTSVPRHPGTLPSTPTAAPGPTGCPTDDPLATGCPGGIPGREALPTYPEPTYAQPTYPGYPANDPYPTGGDYPTTAAPATTCPAGVPTSAQILTAARQLAGGRLPAGATVGAPRCGGGYLAADLTSTSLGTVLVVLRQSGGGWQGVAIGSYPCTSMASAPPAARTMLNCA
jgi:hypothetical protein